MAVIKVPKPPKDVINKDRPISSLLKNQLIHMQEAEFRLPVSGQTDVYINAIQTEGEAADYIRQVTNFIHEHHTARENERAAKAKSGTRPKRKVTAGVKIKTAAKKKNASKRDRKRS